MMPLPPEGQAEHSAAAPRGSSPVLMLAPMQDMTDLPFWRLLKDYGAPDVFYTEYFRVYATSLLDPHLLKSITENETGIPVVAQILGAHIPALVRNARALLRYPIAGIDLNLGCPAPIVCRKFVGGALLKELDKIDAILGALREAITVPFSVKTRLGYHHHEDFEKLLALFIKHRVDLVTIHGRTVKEGYQGPVNWELIKLAAHTLPCPVIGNGDIWSSTQAQMLLETTGVHGLMIGRGAIRNPWIFAQIRKQLAGQPVILPSGRLVLDYIRRLFDIVGPANAPDKIRVQVMKKYMNFIGLGIEPSNPFLYHIRRVTTRADFFRVCETYLDHDQPMKLEPAPI